MKKLFKLLTLILLLFSISNVYAQDSDKQNETQESEEWDDDEDWDDDNWDHDLDEEDDDWEEFKSHWKNHGHSFNHRDFGFYIGLNSYQNAIDMPVLRAWPSRYIALQWRRNHRIIKGKAMDVAIGTGLEIAWNNFMMQNNEKFYENDGLTYFEEASETLTKSKLVLNTLNIPLLFQFRFNKSEMVFGLGMFGGVRIHSYQKFKNNEKSKYKEKSPYNLQQFNYGFMAEAGHRNVRIFAKYDMLPMFNEDNPINANVLTVGFRL